MDGVRSVSSHVPDRRRRISADFREDRDPGYQGRLATGPFASDLAFQLRRATLASVTRKMEVGSPPDDVWDAIRDVGALHTRLVPGFVVDTRIEGSTRIVTFGNGRIVREPIVTIDDGARRIVWTSEGGAARHYNAAIQVVPVSPGVCSVTWTADFLPDDIKLAISSAMDAGMAVMKKTLEKGV